MKEDCETCKYWKQDKIDFKKGLCRNPKNRWGVEYDTGEYVEWWTTGCYANCKSWEARDGLGKNRYRRHGHVPR